MKKIALALAGLFLAAGLAFAAGSALTVTSSNPGGNFTRYNLAWTSDDSAGTVALPFVARGGSLVQFKFYPGTGGTQPSNLYDVTITDADGFDILQGQGANLSNATATLYVVAAPGFMDGGTYTVNVSGAGNSKTGRIVLYVR